MKVRLKSIQQADLAELWAISQGPTADLEWKKWDGPYFKDPILSWETFATGWGKDSVDNPLRKAIVVDDKLVGIVTAYWEDGQLRRWLDMGIVIYDHSYWGYGVGTHALEQWLTELFGRFLHLQTIGFTTWSGNIGMQKLGEKLGMSLEARVRKVRFWQNQFFDSLKYGILREEWVARSEEKQSVYRNTVHSVAVGNAPYLKAASHYLRYAIFVLEKGINQSIEFDDQDGSNTIYSVLFQGEKPIATARLLVIDSQMVRIGRVATTKAFRGRGFGRTVVQSLENYASEAGAQTVELHAELTAAAFYETFGYQREGQVYQEDGIACVTLKKTLQ